LPASHGVYLEPFAAETQTLGVLCEPYCIWGVPDYVPAGAVDQATDLLRPEVLARMERRIQGINPGAGISRFSRAIVERYRLGNVSYHFEHGSEADCFGAFERVVSAGLWVVIPLCHPQ
jgi:glycine betaine/proline transport system substrate-binding protein